MNKINFYLQGDWHGQIPWYLMTQFEESDEATAAIILCGDSGVNWYGEHSKKDRLMKARLQESGNLFYILAGNHDARPEHLSTIEKVYDDDVQGYVYYEPEFPAIRYFLPFGIYYIDGYKVGVIGHAYSVDKPWREHMGWTWFEDEQLSSEEIKSCRDGMFGQHYDLIISHTCPIGFQPVDLFLPQVDQSKVDKTMELFLQELIENCTFNKYVFAHYHVDRWQEDDVRIIYKDLISLKSIMD